MEKPLIKRDRVIYIDVDFQKELLKMENSEREAFIKDMPDWEAAADNILDEVKNLLDMVTFFTVIGGKEVKGHNIKRGSSVYEAAGKIHTDIQKGFVRAKVFSFDELMQAGFDPENLKKQGKVRTEGRDYPVRDGEIIEILFG
jgi:ribosome-binding ATPase YchF (GTP1/OBG family)